MDAKTILNPKWWLLAFGVLFLLGGLSNYLGAEGSADTAYPGDYTPRDVFYEQTFGLFTMVMATMAIVTALKVSGRELSILSMTSSGAMIAFLLLHYMAGEEVNYGFNNPVTLGVVVSLVAVLGISGYLHLGGGTEIPEDSSEG
ncbi:MAG: hypothetical protein ACPGOT_03635 [Candidatus Poseidoniaceae archaeon]